MHSISWLIGDEEYHVRLLDLCIVSLCVFKVKCTGLQCGLYLFVPNMCGRCKRVDSQFSANSFKGRGWTTVTTVEVVAN